MIERRSGGRTPTAKSALVNFGRGRGLFACMVRDFTASGAKLQFGDLNVPKNLVLSLDNFETTQTCRLVWRNKPYVGVVFQTPLTPASLSHFES